MNETNIGVRVGATPEPRWVQVMRAEVAETKHFKVGSVTHLYEMAVAFYDEFARAALRAPEPLTAPPELKAALEWYRDEALALAINLEAKRTVAVTASVQVLALDAGNRGITALALLERWRAALGGGVSPQQGWDEGFVKGHAMASEIRDIGEALIAARAKFGLEGGVEEAEYIDHLRAHLRSVVDAYEALLDDGEFPAPRNRTADEKESIAQWWEDSHNRVKLARAALEHPENAPQHGQRGNK